MRILISAHVFPPSIGGIESCSRDFAAAFAALGHQVLVLTQTPSHDPLDDGGLKVIRRPGKLRLLRALHWCDVYFQSNISLKTAWPLLFIKRPWIVCTHIWLRNPAGQCGLPERLKRLVLRFATNVYISQAIHQHVGYRGAIIPNPYQNKLFRVIPGIPRERDLVFLGRLVSDKGCDLLIHSLALLKSSGLAIPLTIIGHGPEEAALRKQAAQNGVEDLLKFKGMLKGEALAIELNRHRVMVVPSRWEEPFGMVALEGIACGCLIVGSAAGGLGDAIGPCGLTFKNGDVTDLSRAIRDAFEKDEIVQRYYSHVSNHLEQHRLEHVASQYLNVFDRACVDSSLQPHSPNRQREQIGSMPHSTSRN